MLILLLTEGGMSMLTALNSSVGDEELWCLCGQYRWALSNPRQARLTTYHCGEPSESQRAQVCTEDGCYGTCRTDGYCFKNIKRNQSHVIKTYE